MSYVAGFNATEVEPNTGEFSPIPEGEYVAVITSSEDVANKDKPGGHLKLEFEIVEGDQKGKKLFARLNLDNPNQQAVNIARSDLSAICHAASVMQLNASQQLHDIPIGVKIAVRSYMHDGEKKYSNEIKKYMKRSEVAAQAPGQTVGQSPAAGNDETPPWKR